jgi:hypothetical protein
MPYILRVVQRYRPENRAAFMELEAEFAAMEQGRTDFPKGRRRQPVTGRLPTNTLIWECEFPSLSAVQETIARFSSDPRHEELFRQQVPYMEDAYTEIDETLDFSFERPGSAAQP